MGLGRPTIGDRATAAEAVAMDLAIALAMNLDMVGRMAPSDASGAAVSDINRKIADIVVVAIEAAPALNSAKAAAGALQRACRRGDGKDPDEECQNGGNGNIEAS
jgi:sugar (pentulose or hexulose) kinase